MHIRDTSTLRKHEKHIYTEAILTCSDKFLGKVLDQPLQFTVIRGMIFDCHQKLTDSISLKQKDSFLFSCYLSDNFINHSTKLSAHALVQVGVLNY